jgi:hypothetical protein
MTTSKEVVSIEEQIKKQLQGLQDRMPEQGSNKISIKGKVFTLPDGSTAPEMNAIILDWRWALAHYPGVFDPKNPQDPDCQAIGSQRPESGHLKPHASVESPHAADCASCPKNQWGSGQNGKGKACKNQIRLLVVPPSSLEEDDVIQPYTLYVNRSSLKGFSAYTGNLASVHQLDLVQVITKITFDPNETHPKLQFKMAAKHSALERLWKLRSQHQDTIERPIPIRAKAA